MNVIGTCFKADPIDMERQAKAERTVRRRQDPVSCRLCRLKKLKCNRLHPCSNCTARGTECEFDSNQTVASNRIQQDAEPSNSAILSRLQRLEDMILRMNQNLPTTPESVNTSRKNDPDQPLVTAMTPVEESHMNESNDLSSIGTRQPSLLPAMSYNYIFITMSMDQISRHDHAIFESADSVSNRQSQRRILMPAYADALILYDKYARFVCHFHNMVHMPTLRKSMDAFYISLARKEAPSTDVAVLLLSIFTTVMCYVKLSGDNDVFSEVVIADSEAVYLGWFRAALDLLDHSRRVLPGSLELVQATIILVFLDYNLEGFTSRARAILTQGIQTAKELALHRLDSPAAVRRREINATAETMIDTEFRRRVWWHMVSTDWMVSLAGSSQEGTYTAHPHQMRVRLPRNIETDVLDAGNVTEDLPLTHPTAMSYPLQRIRLGEVSRTIVDTLRFGITDPTEHDYNQILQLDKRVRHFIEDLPIFLSMDPEHMRKSQYIVERHPYFGMQRYIINIGAQSIRCKLHQPFLVHSGDKSQFTQSAQICISAAMEVININKRVTVDQSPYIPKKLKISGFLHHLFLATVVIVMDLCFNGLNGVDDPRNAEVLSAIRMLEAAREESISVQKFLDSLTEALKRHQVRLIEAPKEQQASHQPSGLFPPPNTQNWMYSATQQMGLQAPSQNASMGFDDVWRGIIDQGDTNVMPDWDQLFSELDTFIA